MIIRCGSCGEPLIVRGHYNEMLSLHYCDDCMLKISTLKGTSSDGWRK